MGSSSSFAKVMLAGTALAASLMGVTIAAAQEGPPVPVSFHDPVAALGEGSAPAIGVTSQRDIAPRFELTPTSENGPAPRRLELEVSAGGGNSPVDVSVAQRATLNADDDSDRRGSGSELRIGRGMVERREGGSEPSVYMFVASEDEALTWQPGGGRSEFGGRSGGGLALEDRVEVGDMAAGVTYERNGVQASLAYVEREESTRVGRESYTQEQAFTGVTLTMRR
ncbi:hypothetical protein [Terricaulis silvestris]|uniref:Uncharacterized protein n=1 Tax=Terricaulis silvestris TaxID=2686094 RepID=A0A6I6MXT3_9CAUL|nr:hypothetical protein [Terricaulis silvestris]QGZ95993.1 hypothetical protein DSM104635_02849 [Terricaulis silvestris]